MPRLSDEIVALAARLDDAGLYARDPKAFDTATRRLSATRSELAGAEEDWLELAARRETLAKGG